MSVFSYAPSFELILKGPPEYIFQKKYCLRDTVDSSWFSVFPFIRATTTYNTVHTYSRTGSSLIRISLLFKGLKSQDTFSLLNFTFSLLII